MTDKVNRKNVHRNICKFTAFYSIKQQKKQKFNNFYSSLAPPHRVQRRLLYVSQL